MFLEITIFFWKSIILFSIEVVIVSEVGSGHWVFKLWGSWVIVILAMRFIMLRSIDMFLSDFLSDLILPDLFDLFINFLSLDLNDELFLTQLSQVFLQLSLHSIYLFTQSINITCQLELYFDLLLQFFLQSSCFLFKFELDEFMCLNCCLVLLYFCLNELLSYLVWLSALLWKLIFKHPNFKLECTQWSHLLKQFYLFFGEHLTSIPDLLVIPMSQLIKLPL